MSTSPVQVINLTGAASIAAGYTFSLVSLSDGTVWSFGIDLYGQLGNGMTTDINTANSTPVQALGLTGVQRSRQEIHPAWRSNLTEACGLGALTSAMALRPTR